MYIEELTDKEEKGERSVKDCVDGGDKAIFVSRGNVIVLTTKKALVGVGARALFYPTLIYNVVRNKLEAEFQWWDRVAEVNKYPSFELIYVSSMDIVTLVL